MAMTDLQVRNLHYGTAAMAVVLLLAVLLLLTGPANAAARLAVIVLLVVLLGVQVWLFLEDRKSITKAEEAGWTPPAEPAAEVAGAPKMVIRCKQCGEVFPVADTGVRPLAAHCPHCGREGTIHTRAQG